MYISSRSLRRFILIQLSKAESSNVSRDDVCMRISNAFLCRSIVVAQKRHQELGGFGFHYCVAVLNDSASRHTAPRIIRELFSEFEGERCIVKFRKGWKTLCADVVKEDKTPQIWGIEEIQKRGISKKKAPEEVTAPGPNWDLLMIKLEKQCDSWLDIYSDPLLVEQLCILGYQNLRQIYDDLKTRKVRKSSFCERLIFYLANEGWPQEYLPEDILEKYVLIDWVACQLIFHRPMKTKQMLVYGEPDTQKTLLVHLLSKVLRIYFVSSRIHDFAGADDYYDLWIFDQFREPKEDNRDDIAYAHTLLKVLDGQECRLDDGKCGGIFTKKVNVPILMISNELAERVKQPGTTMQKRLSSIRFHSRIPNLDQGRVIATLYGCIRRRIQSVNDPKLDILLLDETIEKVKREFRDPTEVAGALQLLVSACKKNYGTVLNDEDYSFEKTN